MRTQMTLSVAAITVFALLGAPADGNAQSLRRPVNEVSSPEVSLAALAAQTNPALASSIGATRTYTNADLKLRPAPVAPVTPPFPEIAAPSFILEHQTAPEIEPAQTQQPMYPELYYGLPIWDGGVFPFGFNSFGQGNGRHSNKNFQNAPDPFRPFIRPDVVHFSGAGDFSVPGTPSGATNPTKNGSRGMRSQQGGNPGSRPGQGGRGSGQGGHGSRGR